MKRKNPYSNRRGMSARQMRRASQPSPKQSKRAIQKLINRSISAAARKREEPQQP